MEVGFSWRENLCLLQSALQLFMADVAVVVNILSSDLHSSGIQFFPGLTFLYILMLDHTCERALCLALALPDKNSCCYYICFRGPL